jgi:HEPN domain-containing protein
MTPTARPDEAAQLLAAVARDRRALAILSRDPDAPAEIALFLAQQALEKCIKAVLALKGVTYRRTHDLLLLESLVQAAGLRLPIDRGLLARIAPYAVEFRYLGASAPTVSLTEAQAAVDAAAAWSAAQLRPTE